METDWLKVFPGANPTIDVEYFIGGEAYYAKVLSEISQLQPGDSLYIMGWMLDVTFMLDPTNPFSRLIDIIKDKSAIKNIEIKIIIWNNPFYLQEINDTKKLLDLYDIDYIIESSQYKLLEISTIEIANNIIASSVLNHVELIAENSAKIDFYLQEWRKNSPNKNSISICSYHDKLTILIKKNEVIAYCGGIDYNSNRLKGYHDVQCRVVGASAIDILKKFIAKWGEFQVNPKIPKKIIDINKQMFFELPSYYTVALGNQNYHGDGKKLPAFYRTLSDAYIKIIENAKKFIYIEDQYLINIDVAKKLNKRLKDIPSLIVILLFQCDEHTVKDLLISGRKRQEFINIIDRGIDNSRIYKFTIIKNKAKNGGYASIIHSKILIVDDEIAIIGSSNVNQRSFTYDSETSLIIFNAPNNGIQFAKKLRVDLWTDYALGEIKDREDKEDIKDVEKFLSKIGPRPLPFFSNVAPPVSKTKLDHYFPDISLDIDERAKQIIRAITNSSVGSKAFDKLFKLTKGVANLLKHIDFIYDEYIDPKAK